MCFYYTNVRTNSRFEFCIITILVGKLLNFFILRLCQKVCVSEMTFLHKMFKKKYLKIVPLEQNGFFFFFIKKKPDDQIKSNGPNDITPDLTVPL